MKGFLHLASPVATLVGILVSTWGTYRLMRYYYALSRWEFWKSLAVVCFLATTFQPRRLKEMLKVVAWAGEKAQENRYDSIVGAYLLFLGFALQLFGAVCWCIESKIY
jgi:hypothetical protein